MLTYKFMQLIHTQIADALNLRSSAFICGLILPMKKSPSKVLYEATTIKTHPTITIKRGFL
jgi:hypothetical protein